MTSTPSPAEGLFGPGSVTRRILAEPVMWVGGLRAMYLQALHPRTMRATWQNTAFARPGEAWGRFGRTVEFVRVRTYGSAAEVERAGRRVRKVHASLTGTDADGSVIRLDEPELLLWVHCGEIASYADVARRSGIRLSAGELDEFVAEQRRSAAVVGLDPAGVPGSMAELDAYYERMRPRLYACDPRVRGVLPGWPSRLGWHKHAQRCGQHADPQRRSGGQRGRALQRLAVGGGGQIPAHRDGHVGAALK